MVQRSRELADLISRFHRDMGCEISARDALRHPQNGEAVQECHIVFISRSEQPRLKQVLAALRSTSALIVIDAGDAGDFCRTGGMIRFFMEGRKVRFELNQDAAERAGLKIDPKLKRVSGPAKCDEGR